MKKYFALFAVAAMLTACHKDDDDITAYQIDTTIVYEYNPTFIIQDQQPVTTRISPPKLSSGNLVAVCAASNSVSESDVLEGINILKSWGLDVVCADNLYKQDGRYAGTLDERIQGFQTAIDDPDVKAIFFARGGYGAAQILPYIDFTKFLQSPKWIIGYSDVTALHITLNNMGVESVLGPMMRGFNNDKQSNSLLQSALFGKYEPISIRTNDNCVKGTASGRLVGGNLSIIYSLSGTAFDLNTKDAILFIEDTGEANYSIDRMLLNLQQSGKLTDIKGLIVGEFINNNQGNDQSLPDIIKKYFGGLKIPVVYGFPNGHDTQNLPVILGSDCTITVDDSNATVSFGTPAA
ncbi:MAG: LD-carboxypeptidase [Bacteroidales bacterium]|nr:LD-carboxypeptidase [Bacteroidales bacterium]